MRHGWLRPFVVAVWIVVLSNGPVFFVARRLLGSTGRWEDPSVQPFIVLTAASGVAFVVLDRFRLSGRTMRTPAMLPLAAATALGGWAALSASWSLQPEVSLWRGLVYTALPFVAWVIADLSFADWNLALSRATGVLIGASILLVVLWPEVGLDHNDDWRGIMTGRNSLAPVFGLGVLSAAALLAEGRRLPGSILGVAGLVGIVQTGSRTALFALVLALAFASLVVVGRRAQQQLPPRLVATVGGGLLLAGTAVAGIVLRSLWNEPTFSQRRTIWDLLSENISDNVIAGVGWEAFWYTPELHTHELLQRGSAHGSIPELLLGLGVVGLVLWLVVVGTAWVGVVREAWVEASTEAWLWLAVVSFLSIENLTESFVLWFSYNWVLLIAAALRFGPPSLSRPGLRMFASTTSASG